MIQEISALPAKEDTLAGTVVFRNTDGEAEIGTTSIGEYPEGIADNSASVAGDAVRIVIFGAALGIAGEAITAAHWNRALRVGTDGKLFLLEKADFVDVGTSLVYTVGRVRGTAAADGSSLAVFVNPTPIAFFTVTP